jgi:hypothetical protein
LILAMNRRIALFGFSVAALAVSAPTTVNAATCGAATACSGATSVTYGGVAMTLLTSATTSTVRTELWYLLAPPTGTNNVVVTAPVPTALTATSMSFTGALQAAPTNKVNTTGNNSVPSLAVTSPIGSPIFDVLGAVGTTTLSLQAGTGQTLAQTNNTSTGVDHVLIGSSTAPGTGSAYTMQWTKVSGNDWAYVATEVQSAAAHTDVTVEDLTATREANNVLVEWHDGYEPHSLGFYVFRSDAGGPRVQLNSEIIPGGALEGTSSVFSWTDGSAGWSGGDVSYWIKDLNVDGSFVWYGPAVPSTPGAVAIDGSAQGGFGGAGPSTGPTAPGETGGNTTPAGGCAVVARDPSGAMIQLFLVLGLIAGTRRGKRRWLTGAIYVLAIVATGILIPHISRGANDVAVDSSATGSGASGLTFAHTMGTGANGIILVGVVTPIVCDTTTTDAGNCGACGTTCAGNTGGTLANGLLGLWHFDDGSGTTTLDGSGNNNTANLFGGYNWVAGYEGKALQFDGATGTPGSGGTAVQAPFGSWFASNNTMSVSAWVYMSANTNGPVFGVSSVPGGGTWNMPFLSVNGLTAYGWIWMVNGNNWLPFTVAAAGWHHLAITYDPSGSGTEIFYVDGTSVGTGTGTFLPAGAGTTDYFTTNIAGAVPTGVNHSLLGRIDEARAYNRVLTPTEVSSLSTARLACSASTCAACPALQTACGGTCTTTNTDNNNCGSCGHVCNTAGGESCVSGVCTCSSGTDCSGTCVVISTDANNCGSCGHSCGMATSSGIDNGLLGHWMLDAGTGTTAIDSSGNGNSGTLTSSATWTTGYSGDAFAGDGVNSISANLGTWLGGNNPLTASAWVYATSSTNGPLFGVTSIPAGGTWNMPFLSVAGSTVYGHIWMVNGNSALSATVGLNNWHFLAITYDPSGGGTEKFYVDGMLSQSGTGTYLPSFTTDTWSTNISGTKPAGVNSILTGKIDDVRAYSRVLSAAEISIIFNARQTCTASVCGGCVGSEVLCGVACTDKTIDPSNCGTCGTTCNTSGGETCNSSSCGCTTGTDCSGTCIDTTTNNANCGSCGHVCSTTTCASCSQGMLGLWHLDEGSGATSMDLSGTGNNLTLIGSPGPSWVTGESGDALQFNGTNYMYANIGTPFTTSTTISANAWVFATSSSNGPIFGVSQTMTGGVWDMPFLSINGSTVYGWLWQVNGNNPLSATVSLNNWHMLTITYDPSGSGTETFYVDGVLSSSGTGTFVGASTGMMTPVSVYLTTSIAGAKPTGVNSVLSGTVDELRGYTRVLSAGEVSLLYNARQTCAASSCGGCPTGTTLCTAVCTNLQADKNNCNSCGHACTSGQTCVAGTCM